MSINHSDTDLFVVETNTDSIISSPTTKSEKIRQLYSIGYKKAAIAKLLNIRYQHVRNVLLQLPKRK